MTNGIGPEKFQRCASQWIPADSTEPQPNIEGTCMREEDPPKDDFCMTHTKEIEKLRF